VKWFDKRKAGDKVEFDFYPRDTEAGLVIPKPKPAKSYYPEWLKKMPNHFTDNHGYEIPGTATHCMPYVDSFVNGYIQELACDVHVRHEGTHKDSDGIEHDIIRYRWAGPIAAVGTRAEQFNAPNMFPKFDGYYNTEMHWNSFWEPKTPPGYSTLYHHPSNRPDLPFYTFSGIIDTDRWNITGPVPFIIKEGFVGTIPAGTPIYQMTFIKRNEWHSSFKEYNAEEQAPLRYSVRRFTKDGYKKQIWIPKRFY
jgi:hypothetical protein